MTRWEFEAHWHVPKGILVGFVWETGKMVSVHLGAFYLCWWRR